MKHRERLSATIEAELLAAGRRAVKEGRAPNLSSWVNDALARQAEHERRLKALDEAIREYEAEHGVITEEEIRAARRYFRAHAIPVRPRGQQRPARPRRTRGAA